MFFIQEASATHLEVLKTEYRIPENSPSCQLLMHREIEREKMIRELIHLDTLSDNPDVVTLLLMNYLHTNKEFLDHELWSDETVEVSQWIATLPVLETNITEEGLDEQIFEVDALGFYWVGPVFNFPKGVIFTHLDSQTLKIEYKIYLSNYCGHADHSANVRFFEKGSLNKRETHEMINILL